MVRANIELTTLHVKINAHMKMLPTVIESLQVEEITNPSIQNLIQRIDEICFKIRSDFEQWDGNESMNEASKYMIFAFKQDFDLLIIRISASIRNPHNQILIDILKEVAYFSSKIENDVFESELLSCRSIHENILSNLERELNNK